MKMQLLCVFVLGVPVAVAMGPGMPGMSMPMPVTMPGQAPSMPPGQQVVSVEAQQLKKMKDGVEAHKTQLRQTKALVRNFVGQRKAKLPSAAEVEKLVKELQPEKKADVKKVEAAVKTIQKWLRDIAASFGAGLENTNEQIDSWFDKLEKQLDEMSHPEVAGTPASGQAKPPAGVPGAMPQTVPGVSVPSSMPPAPASPMPMPTPIPMPSQMPSGPIGSGTTVPPR